MGTNYNTIYGGLTIDNIGGLMALSSIFVVTNSVLLQQLHGSDKNKQS